MKQAYITTVRKKKPVHMVIIQRRGPNFIQQRGRYIITPVSGGGVTIHYEKSINLEHILLN